MSSNNSNSQNSNSDNTSQPGLGTRFCIELGKIVENDPVGTGLKPWSAMKDAAINTLKTGKNN